MVCKYCKSVMADGAKFCKSCGNKMPEKKSYCKNCGKEISDSASFCEGCGIPVGGSILSRPLSTAPTGKKSDAQMVFHVIGIILLGIVSFISISLMFEYYDEFKFWMEIMEKEFYIVLYVAAGLWIPLQLIWLSIPGRYHKMELISFAGIVVAVLLLGILWIEIFGNASSEVEFVEIMNYIFNIYISEAGWSITLSLGAALCLYIESQL